MRFTMDLETQYCAHNYHPLPVVVSRGKGEFIWDDEGNRYRDMMRAYSAASHGHANPRLAPPLVISKAEIDRAVTQIRDVPGALNTRRLAS